MMKAIRSLTPVVQGTCVLLQYQTFILIRKFSAQAKGIKKCDDQS